MKEKTREGEQGRYQHVQSQAHDRKLVTHQLPLSDSLVTGELWQLGDEDIESLSLLQLFVEGLLNVAGVTRL